MENLEQGFMLMIVGMATVFVILLIVIGLGNLLIAVVNKYGPAEVIKKKKIFPVAIPQNVMKVIGLTVAQVTGGKGKVSKVEKIK